MARIKVSKREFQRDDKGRRLVKAAVYKYHMYHPECAPEGAKEEWARTGKSICAKCGKSLYKNNQ